MSDDPLTDIHGIGESKAEEIRRVIDSEGNSDAKDALENALDYMDAGNHEYAEKFVRRAYEGL